MIKKITSSLVLFIMTLPPMYLYAVPWSHVPEYEKRLPKSLISKLVTRAKNNRPKQISYCIYYRENPQTAPISEEDLETQIQIGFYHWTKTVAYMLRNHPQEAKFRDVANFLEGDITFKRTPNENCPAFGKYLNKESMTNAPDISFIYSQNFATRYFKREETRNFCHTGTNPFISLYNMENSFNNSNKKTYAKYFLEAAKTKANINFELTLKKEESLRAIFHELGHAFMLADDEYYKTPTRTAQTQQQFIQNIERRANLPTATPMPSTTSLMGTGGKLTYDDIEAYIATYDNAIGYSSRTIKPSLSGFGGEYKGGKYLPAPSDFDEVERELLKFKK